MDRNYNHNALDLFRIIATIQVFLGHVISHFSLSVDLTEPIYFLRGVPILFVLCGFLAAKSMDRYTPKEYLIRRAGRILPGFWACILINTLIIFILYGLPSLLDGAVYAFTQFFGLNFYTGDWLRGYGVGTPNGVLWTIGVQIQFFILVPLLYRWMKKLGMKKSLVFVGICTAASILLQGVSVFLPEILFKLISVTVFPYLYFLMLGMAGYLFRDEMIPRLEAIRFPLLALYILWKFAENRLSFTHLFDGVMYNTVTTLLVSLLVLGFAFTFRWRMKRDLTYGFYLYHMVFINIAVELGVTSLHFDFKSLAVMILVIALSLAASYLSQKFVENPAAKLAEKKEGK